MNAPYPNKKLGKTFGMLAAIFLIAVLYFVFENELQSHYNPNHKIETRIDQGETTIHLEANKQGHYVATGYIGNTPVTFLLDTGATLVALPTSIAAAANLPQTGTAQTFSTANGNTTGYLVNIPSIRLGGLEVKNVQGAVMSDQALSGALLGMSFLKHLKIEQDNQELILSAP